MPQLDVSTYTSQLFWLFITFVTLYVFTKRVSIPRIAKIFELRWQRIEGSLKRADELKHQSERIRSEFEASLDVAREKAHENVMQMIHKVNVTTAQRKNDITSMMIARVQSSEAHIARQKQQALGDIVSIAESVATTTVGVLTEEKVDRAHVKKVLDQLMEQKVA